MGYLLKYLIFFGHCYLALSQKRVLSTSTSKCPTDVEGLVRGGCPRGCITVTRQSFPCVTCRDGCRGISDKCRPNDQSTCLANQLCLAVGVAGQYNCVNRTKEGMNCTIKAEKTIERFVTKARLSNIQARKFASKIASVGIPCGDGLVCRRDSLEGGTCVPENTIGPCSRAKRDNAELKCDEDGNYEPLQCHRLQNRRQKYRCLCRRANGEKVPDTTEDVDDPDEGPDCEDRVNRRCRYMTALGVVYDVRSGSSFINVQDCSKCLCRNGIPTLCKRLNINSCIKINPTPVRTRHCMFRGRKLQHGQTVNVSCNRCRCRNGKLACTKRACEEDLVEDGPEQDINCRACTRMRKSPVCGNDGRTYPSRCFAVNCRGLGDGEIVDGRCSALDVCKKFPCEEGQVCVRVGGVTCLSRRGCRSTRLRGCVDLQTLTCDSRPHQEELNQNTGSTGDENEDDDDDVCGSDGRTYSSVCSMLQNSGKIQIAYAGRCNRTECSGGQVCGTDGETYGNICELRANSANARVDYKGPCRESEPDEMVSRKCRRIRRSGNCPNITLCENLTQPEDGCCPICGGAVTLALDSKALDEYVELNPSVDTVDELVKRLVASGFIPERILRRCKMAVNMLKTGDLHLVFENVNRTGNACYRFVQEIAKAINNPREGLPTTMTTTAFPQVLQFATVAQTSLPVESAQRDGGTILMASIVTQFALVLITVQVASLI